MAGQVVLTGRAKDTIVLSGGENVAPAPIEDALCRSPLLEHAVVVGQDKRTLGVLVCLSEDELRLRMSVRAPPPPPPLLVHMSPLLFAASRLEQPLGAGSTGGDSAGIDGGLGCCRRAVTTGTCLS